MEPVLHDVRHKEYENNTLRAYGGGSHHFDHDRMRCPIH
jgi:hypothetical protein